MDQPTFFAVTPAGLFPCRTAGLAAALCVAMGGRVTTYDPRAVFVPPDPVEAERVALAA